MSDKINETNILRMPYERKCIDREKTAAAFFTVNVKQHGITKETAHEYLSIAQKNGVNTAWLEINIWSKLDIETLKALQKELEEQCKWMREDGAKTISDCAIELYFYISAREEKTGHAKLHAQLPDKMKTYDKNKDGEITENEVYDLKAFVADLKSLSAEERTTVLKQTSAEFRLKLLEVLFKTNRQNIPKPYIPSKHGGKVIIGPYIPSEKEITKFEDILKPARDKSEPNN